MPILIPIENHFYITTTHIEPFKKYGIVRKNGRIAKNLPSTINSLCKVLDDESLQMSEFERGTIQGALFLLVQDNRRSQSPDEFLRATNGFKYCLRMYGPEVFPIAVWNQLLKLLSWEHSVRLYLEMPTAILESPELKHYTVFKKTGQLNEKKLKEILQIISKRDDHWGQLPPEMVAEFLFKKVGQGVPAPRGRG